MAFILLALVILLVLLLLMVKTITGITIRRHITVVIRYPLFIVMIFSFTTSTLYIFLLAGVHDGMYLSFYSNTTG